MEALEDNRIPEEIENHFKHEYCFGHWEDRSGIAELCTNPLREQQIVLRWHQDRVCWTQQKFNGRLQEYILST